MTFVRSAAVAGSFYPAKAAQLRAMLEVLLQEAAILKPSSLEPTAVTLTSHGQTIRQLAALQVPHAGYEYSGVIAAAGYQLLKGLHPRRVVLLGPTHRVGVRGIALSEASAFATPLGEVPVDQDTQRSLIQNYDFVHYFEPSHNQEHSIEVQLPFLQTVLEGKEFQIIPLLVGDCPPDQVSTVLHTLMAPEKEGSPTETLVILSSDLSHYLPYKQAQHLDDATLKQILQLEYPLDTRQACGAYPWSGMLREARKEKLHAQILATGNSGDTAGDKDSVVGYSTVAFWREYPPRNEYGIPDEFGEKFPKLSRAILEGILAPQPLETEEVVSQFIKEDPALQILLNAYGASFVTLTKNGRLRGCIGSLNAHRKMSQDLAANTQAAAFRDPRFPAIQAEELPDITIEVSVLTSPQPFDRLPGESNEAFVARLRPGTDGVILRKGFHRATFLPQVWSQLPDPKEFIDHLMAKAGLDSKEFDENVQLDTYQIQAWRETE